MSDKLYEIVSKVMNVPLAKIDDSSSPESIEHWDSFSFYVLLDEIESAFGVKFTLEETVQIKNVGDFKKSLTDHGITLN
jgi:acyl carrier protein